MTNLYINLGKLGDIMSILPFLYAEYKVTGKKQGLLIATEFHTVLQGVKYVYPWRHDGPHFEISKAVSDAKARFPNAVVCCQVNGPQSEVLEHTYKPAGQTQAMATSFQKEAWKVAGKLDLWDSNLPLVFDNRDSEREERLLRANGLIRRGKQKPLLLLALKSESSPFEHADELRRMVTEKFSDKYRIMDLPQADRIYDLLALYEKAALLIAVDSAPLHLAWACRKLPVFALTQDKPLLWNGSPWRPNHLWYCRYGDWKSRKEEMADAITSMSLKFSTGPWVTVWSAYNDPTHYGIGPQILPVFKGMAGRDTENILGDEKRSPYLRDVLRMAMQRSEKDTTQINLTRPNIKIPSEVASCVAPFYAYRLTETPNGPQFSPIIDLFCATKSWWRDALKDIPDLVLGSDYYWSECLLALFKGRGATDATGCCSFVKSK